MISFFHLVLGFRFWRLKSLSTIFQIYPNVDGGHSSTWKKTSIQHCSGSSIHQICVDISFHICDEAYKIQRIMGTRLLIFQLVSESTFYNDCILSISFVFFRQGILLNKILRESWWMTSIWALVFPGYFDFLSMRTSDNNDIIKILLNVKRLLYDQFINIL